MLYMFDTEQTGGNIAFNLHMLQRAPAEFSRSCRAEGTRCLACHPASKPALHV